jgi:microcystin-dependent protein
MDPTLSEVRIFAGNFAPLSWAFCQGQLMSIAENTALFSLLGTTYGGDGQTTFALPDFRGRLAVGTGTGPGLSGWELGQVEGTEAVTLITQNLPSHIHPTQVVITPFGNQGQGDETNPGSGYNSSVSGVDLFNTNAAANNTTMGATPFTLNLSISGGSQPHDNMMPYLALNFIIAVEGIYPSRN